MPAHPALAATAFVTILTQLAWDARVGLEEDSAGGSWARKEFPKLGEAGRLN